MRLFPAVLALVAGSIELIQLHGPTGQRYWINPQEITSLREPIGADLRHLAPNVHCIIVMVSGKFISVGETCDQVRDLVDGQH